MIFFDWGLLDFKFNVLPSISVMFLNQLDEVEDGLYLEFCFLNVFLTIGILEEEEGTD